MRSRHGLQRFTHRTGPSEIHIPPRARCRKSIARQPRRRRSFWLVALIVMVIPLGVLLRKDLGRHGSAPTGANRGGIRTRRKLRSPSWFCARAWNVCLVLAAITAGLKGAHGFCRPAIAAGVRCGVCGDLGHLAGSGCVLDDIGRHSSALALQAGTRAYWPLSSCWW